MRSILFLALVLVGCGGSSTSDHAGNAGGNAGSGGGSGATGGTSGSGGATGGTSGAGAVSGAGGSGAVTGSCMDYLDEPLPANPITIRIKNGKDVPIYLGGNTGTCGPMELYGISNDAG